MNKCNHHPDDPYCKKMRAIGKCLANKEHPRYPEQYSIGHHCKAHEYPVNKEKK